MGSRGSNLFKVGQPAGNSLLRLPADYRWPPSKGSSRPRCPPGNGASLGGHLAECRNWEERQWGSGVVGSQGLPAVEWPGSSQSSYSKQRTPRDLTHYLSPIPCEFTQLPGLNRGWGLSTLLLQVLGVCLMGILCGLAGALSVMSSLRQA